ncbi:integrase_H2C2 domain-containing protein [Trichonephila clavipes]|nr:integrase_H2C2 domain-containing protein [Trichonephila clavipes]
MAAPLSICTKGERRAVFRFLFAECVILSMDTSDGRPEFPNLELAPETAWNLFASPRTGCGEIPFGGVRQESSRVKKVH